ncbi:MAG: hypothetical protein FRX49_05862 [Trebouxia sp. A1-2]|nr:MAG: hypothetical protein FRX49_05862 [Trebouxia sp. A1-2]
MQLTQGLGCAPSERQSSKAADLDKRGVTNAQLDAFMRRSHLVGAQTNMHLSEQQLEAALWQAQGLGRKWHTLGMLGLRFREQLKAAVGHQELSKQRGTGEGITSATSVAVLALRMRLSLPLPACSGAGDGEAG